MWRRRAIRCTCTPQESLSPTPNVTVCELNPEYPGDYDPWLGRFDSAICINVLESVKDPVQVLDSLGHCLKTGGTLVVLVPQGKDLYGSLDEAMGHRRRFSSADLAQALGQAGFEVLAFYQLNKIGALSWWIFGKLLGRKSISKPALKLFDKTVWFWRRGGRTPARRGVVAGGRGKTHRDPPTLRLDGEICRHGGAALSARRWSGRFSVTARGKWRSSTTCSPAMSGISRKSAAGSSSITSISAIPRRSAR